MKKMAILFFLVSCAHEIPLQKPAWVEAIRSGEQSLRVVQGQKIFYRRIAGSESLTKQTSCNLVIMKAEEDIKKEFPGAAKIPYAVEVLYYDHDYKDCAVTLSLSANFNPQTITREVSSEEDQAVDLVALRSELAVRFAITGLTKEEFEKFSKDKVSLIQEKNLCSEVFRTDTYSIHGLTHVCWKGDILAGYCTSRDKQCWTKTP